MNIITAALGRKATIACFLLLIIFSLSQAKPKSQKSISFELQRNVLSPWAKNSSKHSNNFCYSPKVNHSKKPLIFNSPIPSNCSNSRISLVSQECVFKNLAYNARIYYDAIRNSTVTTEEPSIKKLVLSNEFVDLAVDLSSPWSWVKSPVCQTCDRKGKNCQSNQCKYAFNSSLSFGRSFTCENCQIIQKCGEIDSYAEEMTVLGQFVIPDKVRFKDSLQSLIGPKLLWAHALSGQEFLMADGILGLGVEKNMNSETLKGFSKDQEEEGDNNSFRNDDAGDDDDNDEDDEEEDKKKQSNSNKSKKNQDDEDDETNQKKYDYYETDMNILAPIVSQYKGIKSKIFSLFVAEDDSFKYTLTFGETLEKYIYKPSENKILWISSMVSADLVRQYGLWVINLQNIRIARITDELKKKDEELRNKKNSELDFDRSDYLSPVSSISVGNPHSILSLSTTAIVLPGKELQQLVDTLNNEFSLKCAISKEYLFFVVCDDVVSPKEDLSDITIIIEVGYHSVVHLQVNPSDLILNCKKKSKAKDSLFICQMNLQQSYDDKIILGEAALRNQYLAFDQTSNLIGFAPAKNIFNNGSFVRRIAHLFENLEDAIEHQALYLTMIMCLIIVAGISFLFFKYGSTITALIKGKRVLVFDDKNDRIQLATDNPDTIDDQSFQELQQMQNQMDDQGIQNQPSSHVLVK